MALGDMLARAQAAQGMVGAGGGGLPPEMGMEGAPMPEEEMAVETPDIEGALAGVEAALVGMEPGVTEEVMTHVNAIRELVAGDIGAVEEEGIPPEGEVEMPPPEVGGEEEIPL